MTGRGILSTQLMLQNKSMEKENEESKRCREIHIVRVTDDNPENGQLLEQMSGQTQSASQLTFPRSTQALPGNQKMAP